MIFIIVCHLTFFLHLFYNTLEYKSTSGNLTIQLADHLFQFVIVEGFFKELPLPKKNIFRRNFKNFNEREFQEALDNICWNDILSLIHNDPNISLNNFYDQINYLLDELAPYKKLSKKLIILETKPWINIMIQQQMHQRDKLLHDYFKESSESKRKSLYSKYKTIRNKVTNMKRESEINYYKNFFEMNKANTSKIWKGIRSLVKINSSSKKDIQIIDNKGRKIINPMSIANYFNDFFC